MFKKVVALASVTALLATATPAFAHDYRHHGGGHGGGNGALIAFGALAGLAVGAAILSSQHEAPPPVVAYAPAPAYYPPPAYYAPPPPVAYAPAPPVAYAPGYGPAPVYYSGN